MAVNSAHAMEIRSCMKMVGDLKDQTDRQLLSIDDKDNFDTEFGQ